MKEVSDLRRSLAEVTSAREEAEAERKRQVEEEVERIHQVFLKRSHFTHIVCLFIDGFTSGRCYFFTSNWIQKTYS